VINQKNKEIICTAISNGKRHDFRMFKESQVHIHSESHVIVDTGYIGILKLHAKTEIPKKRSKKNPLNQAEKCTNRTISSKRVFVEHVIGKIKRFKILSYPYRNRRTRFGLRFNLISAFYNKDFIR